MNDDLKNIIRQFRVFGDLDDVQPFGSGHINDTYSVRVSRHGETVRYILQRINHVIFRDPSALMDNVIRVTEHIRKKSSSQNSSALSRQLHVIGTLDNRGYFQCRDGNFWRMYNMIEGAVTYEVLTSGSLAFEGARMFGAFQKMLSDLPGTSLHETIPDFHNTPKRLKAFLEVLDRDPCNRAGQIKAEIDFVLGHTSLCNVLLDLQAKGEIPVRVTHNDTKINNVLFDQATDKGVCVIDLDTVMPGISLYDVGDMVRTATCPSAEDERDLSKVHMDITLYEHIVRGFAVEAAAFFAPAEKNYLAFAGKLITFEQMIRFLADHLAGDVYYKIHRPGHNLDRARTQMKLVQSMLEQEDRMNTITEGIWRGATHAPAEG